MKKTVEYEIYIMTAKEDKEEKFNNLEDAKKRYNYLVDQYSKSNTYITLEKITQIIDGENWYMTTEIILDNENN